MATVRIEPGEGTLIEAIEAGVRSRLGDVALQTDFRRGEEGAADASVLVKARLERQVGAALLADFQACPAVESVRLAKQKLSLRFTDSFVAALVESRARGHGGGGPGRGSHAGRRILVDFCDPNANKALHVGHLRNVALGGALAASWRALGAQVTTQSVLCDIGRSVAEALAGLRAAGAEAVLASPEPLSPRLGALYAAYVGEAAVPVAAGAAADAPIAREIARHGDAADIVLDRWRASDPEIVALWRATIARVRDEQAATLARLGIVLDRIVRESDAVIGASVLAEALVARGLAFRDGDGAVVLDTGRPDYARCPLTRSDGFATEHLRALVLWDGLRDALAGTDEVFHVMGQEWRTSTEIRLEVLERLRETGFPARYRMLTHRMVRVGGSDMKSSAGNAILLDDLCDRLDARLRARHHFGDPDEAASMLRTGVLAPMLVVDPEETLDVTLDTLCDERENPGLRIARALAATRAAEAEARPTPRTRVLAFQGERLARMVETAGTKAEPALVARHLVRLADERLARDGEDAWDGDALLRVLLRDGLTSLGWQA
ncbi:arginine--tRNA ligase domain-containing protein [Salinarimonas chemoclinalis]|uniref:arginine--tRNA ligase domain-containing protein n=1 Tax=Salinarimonas chemoclinalis TaxID=3241599 RepID=UPI00355796ED